MAAAEKKLIEKQKKAYKKTQSKNQSISIWRLALSNSRLAGLGTFKDVLSDLATTPLEPDETPTCSSNQLPNDDQALGLAPETLGTDGLIATRLKSSKKKKAKVKSLFRRFNKKPKKNAPRPPTPPPVAMELIRPGK